MSSFDTVHCIHCGAPMASHADVCPACGQPQIADEPPESWIGRTIDGKYRVEDVLGVGGMGMVFGARRVLVGDRVALKVLYPRFLQSPLQRRLFRDEAVAAARLSHPNVVTVFDAELSPEDGRAYIAMELLEGITLKKLLADHAPMPADEILPVIIEMCAGLKAAHEARIVHRDLKPDNIYLERREDGSFRVKLVDFGIAAMIDADRRDERKQRLGTLRYMAPEQCRGGAIDGRADLYALGVLMYEALTRRRATGKTVTAVLEEQPEPVNLLLPDERHVPPPVEDLVMRLLAKSPDDRPANADEVRLEAVRLLARLHGEPVPDYARVPEPTPARPAMRLPLLIGAAVLVGILGGVLWGLL